MHCSRSRAFSTYTVALTNPLIAQYPAAENQQRTEGLVLFPRSHALLYGQAGEKLTDSSLTHFQRMPFAVNEDRALGPVDVGLLGAVGVVLEPD